MSCIKTRRSEAGEMTPVSPNTVRSHSFRSCLRDRELWLYTKRMLIKNKQTKQTLIAFGVVPEEKSIRVGATAGDSLPELIRTHLA